MDECFRRPRTICGEVGTAKSQARPRRSKLLLWQDGMTVSILLVETDRHFHEVSASCLDLPFCERLQKLLRLFVTADFPDGEIARPAQTKHSNWNLRPDFFSIVVPSDPNLFVSVVVDIAEAE